MTDDLITEEWLKSVGFKWHEFDRQGTKHWLLWLGGGLKEKPCLTSYEDIGIELSANMPGREPTETKDWFCWLRSDGAGRYHRFIHLRHVETRRPRIPPAGYGCRPQFARPVRPQRHHVPPQAEWRDQGQGRRLLGRWRRAQAFSARARGVGNHQGGSRMTDEQLAAYLGIPSDHPMKATVIEALRKAFERSRSTDAALLDRALGILHRMGTERTGWRSFFSRWYYPDEPLRNDASNLVREAGFMIPMPDDTRLVGDPQ